MQKNSKLELLKSTARKHTAKGRHRLMTDEQLDLIRKMRSSGFSHSAIFAAMNEQKMMPYKSYQSYYTAYKNR